MSLLSVLPFSIRPLFAEKIEVGTFGRDVDVRLLDSSGDRIRFEVLVGAFEKSPVQIDGKTFYRIGLAGESNIDERGAPDLPHVCRSVVIPDEGEMAVEVVSSEYEEIAGIPVAPSKGVLERTVDPAAVPYEFGEAYGSGAWYPGDLAWGREPYILRDFRGLCVVVQPFAVEGSESVLRVYTRLVVEVHRVGPGGANVLTVHHRDRMNEEFARIYDRHFLNFGAGRYASVGEAGEMLVLTNDAFQADVLPLVDWKNRMGVKTTLADLSSVGGDTASVRAFIRSFYDSTDLAYVLLVGDAAQFPCPTSYGAAADPTYALVSGSDGYPDILVGRLSASTQYQLRTQVERTIAYERDPEEGGSWYPRAMGVASADGPGDDEELDYEHVDVIRDHLLDFTYSKADRIYDPGATAAQVSAALDEGRGLVVYCGHGSKTTWGTTGFSNSHVAALTNHNRLPFIFDVACLNGEFVSGTCFAEAWLRATHAGFPTGAIGVYASSINQYWSPPMAAQDECIDLLVRGEKRTFGGLCFNGSCQMMDEYGVNGERMFNSWHVFGDPSLRVRTGTPNAIVVDHGAVLDQTSTSFTVVVPDVEGALCGLSRDGAFLGSASTDGSGTAVISLTGPVLVGESLALTVTGFNTETYTGTVDVVPHPGCRVEPESIEMAIEPGDTAALDLVIGNDGEAGSVLAFAIDVFPPVDKSIAGSILVSDHATFTPGTTCDIRFLIMNLTPDYEWIKGATIDFPRGVVVNSSTDFTVIGQTRGLATNGAAGNGVEVVWNTAGMWGEIYYQELAEAVVNVTVASDFLHDMEIRWTVAGDGWGAPPHIQYGTMLIPLAGPALLLHAPNGGEAWKAGDLHTITWASSGDLETVSLDYSIDVGSSWIPIASGTKNDGLYEWVVPCTPSGHCLARVSDPSGSIRDGSDGAFRIVDPIGWLAVFPASGTVKSGEESVLRLRVDASALDPGDHEAILLLSNNAGDPVSVPVLLHVSDFPIDPGLSTIQANDDLLLAPGGETGSAMQITVTVRDERGMPVADVPEGAVVVHASGSSSIGESMRFCASDLPQASFFSSAPTDSAGRARFTVSRVGGCGVIALQAEASGMLLSNPASVDVRSPDMDGNGLVNFRDIFIFSAFLRAGSGACGNLDGDPQSVVNFTDTALFIPYISGHSSCP